MIVGLGTAPSLSEQETVGHAGDVAHHGGHIFVTDNLHTDIELRGHGFYHLLQTQHLQVLLHLVAVVDKLELTVYHLGKHRKGIHGTANSLRFTHVTDIDIPEVGGLLQSFGVCVGLSETLHLEEAHGTELARSTVEDEHLVGARLQVEVVAADVVGDVSKGDGITVLGQHDGHAGGRFTEARRPVHIHVHLGLTGVVQFQFVAAART